jgi:hypothetical protein
MATESMEEKANQMMMQDLAMVMVDLSIFIIFSMAMQMGIMIYAKTLKAMEVVVVLVTEMVMATVERHLIIG